MVYSLLLQYQANILWFLRNFLLFKIEEPSETSYLARNAIFFIKIRLEWQAHLHGPFTKAEMLAVLFKASVKMMSSHVLSRLYCVISFCRPGKQIKPFMSNSGFFLLK